MWVKTRCLCVCVGGGEVIANRWKRQKIVGMRIASANLCYYLLLHTDNMLLIFRESLRPSRGQFRTESMQ
jgi:hypothetical protein